MPDSTDLNSLYQEWLEIPADRLPPNHYALLGVPDYESDTDVIEAAAKARSAYLHQMAAGPNRKVVQDLLGRVAMARRTLLSEASRAEYDHALRFPVASVVLGADGQTPPREHSGGGAASLEVSSTAPPKVTPRKRSNPWKYHAISAAVLLVVVGGIYLFNRAGGGRRAAKISDVKKHPSEMASPAAGAAVANRGGPASKVSASVAKSEDATSNESAGSSRRAPKAVASEPQNRRSVIAERRETGSGLGMGLDSKFADVLSDIADQAKRNDQDSPAASAADSQSSGGLAIGPFQKGKQAQRSTATLTPVKAFPTAVKERFVSNRGYDWFEIKDGALWVNPAKDKNFFTLRDQSVAFRSGDTVAMETSVSKTMRGEIQVGWMVNGVRIGVRPNGKAIEIIARDRGREASAEVITQVGNAAEFVRLTLTRDAKQPDRLRWYLESGPQTLSGEVTANGLPADAALSLFVAAPKQSIKQPLWVRNLQYSATQPK